MSWPKPQIDLIDPPAKPRRWLWLAIFVGSFLVTAVLLILGWQGDDYFNSMLFWILLLLVPEVVFGILIGVRIYIYGLALENYEIWQKEIASIDHNWQRWASKSLAIPHIRWFTPNELSADEILNNLANIPVQLHHALAFEEEQAVSFTHYFSEIFNHFQPTINALADDVPLAITLYSSPQAYLKLDDTLHNVYQEVGLQHPYHYEHQIVDNTELDSLIEMLDKAETAAHIVIINNTRSDQTAFLSALMFITPDLLPITAKQAATTVMLRPMLTDKVLPGLEQMISMQPTIKSIKQLWCANLDKQSEMELILYLANQQVNPEMTHYLDVLNGHQNDLSYWSLLALAMELVDGSNQPILIASKSQHNYLLTVLAPSTVIDEQNKETT